MGQGRKTVNRLIFIVAVLFPELALSATAEWVQVHQNAGGDTIYIDNAKIIRDQGLFATQRRWCSQYRGQSATASI
jgi:hypothetical protein